MFWFPVSQVHTAGSLVKLDKQYFRLLLKSYIFCDKDNFFQHWLLIKNLIFYHMAKYRYLLACLSVNPLFFLLHQQQSKSNKFIMALSCVNCLFASYIVPPSIPSSPFFQQDMMSTKLGLPLIRHPTQCKLGHHHHHHCFLSECHNVSCSNV